MSASSEMPGGSKVQVSHRTRGGGGGGGGGKLRRAAASADHEGFRLMIKDLSAAQLDDCCDASGKNPLHHAAWRGHIDSVRLLLQKGMDVNRWSTGVHNYGKTAIFYALTRSRGEVVEVLLEHRARVRIVNNKGQTPRSIASSHLEDKYVEMISRREEEEEEAGQEAGQEARDWTGGRWSGWKNFRETHSDGVEYGDIDPRFFSPCNVHSQTKFAINPTTVESRRKRRDDLRSRRMREDISENSCGEEGGARGSGGDDAQISLSFPVKSLIETCAQRIVEHIKGSADVINVDVMILLREIDLLISVSMMERNQSSWVKRLSGILALQLRPIGQPRAQCADRRGEDEDGSEDAAIRGHDRDVLKEWYKVAKQQEALVEESTLLHTLNLTDHDASIIMKNVQNCRVKQLRVRLMKNIMLALSCNLPQIDAQGTESKKENKVKDAVVEEDEGDIPFLSSSYLPSSVPALFTAGPTVSRPAPPLSPFSLPIERVRWVNDSEGLEKIKQTMQNLMSSTGNIFVGVDTEWTSIDGVSCISTIQVATGRSDVRQEEGKEEEGKEEEQEETWVIDALSFRQTCRAGHVSAGEELGGFLRWFFNHERIFCLVFSFSQDVKLLRHIVPDLSLSTARVLDLQQLSIACGIGRTSRPPSLRLVYERLFQGRTIDKAQQCSDWSARPLQEEQVRYAAADALVLLHIHRHIRVSAAARPALSAVELSETVGSGSHPLVE